MVVVIRRAVLALVLAVGAVAEGAIDCRGTTPLPDDVTLVAPAADVPENLARFAGAWTGAWRDAKGNEALCTTLVVEEVLANGYARVVYSVGVSEAFGVRIPGYWRAGGGLPRACCVSGCRRSTVGRSPTASTALISQAPIATRSR